MGGHGARGPSRRPSRRSGAGSDRIRTGCGGTRPTRIRPRTSRGGCRRCSPWCARRSTTLPALDTHPRAHPDREPVRRPGAGRDRRGGDPSKGSGGLGAAGRARSGPGRLRPGPCGRGRRRRGRPDPDRGGRCLAVPLVRRRRAGRHRPGVRRLREHQRGGHHAHHPGDAGFCAPGGHVVWTRHRRPPDLTPAIRADFAAAGFTELALRGARGHRHDRRPPPPRRADGALRPRPGRSSTSSATGSIRHERGDRTPADRTPRIACRSRHCRHGDRRPADAATAPPRTASTRSSSSPWRGAPPGWSRPGSIVPALVIFGLDAIQGTFYTEVAVDHLGLGVARRRVPLRRLHPRADLLRRHARAPGRLGGAQRARPARPRGAADPAVAAPAGGRGDPRRDRRRRLAAASSSRA